MSDYNNKCLVFRGGQRLKAGEGCHSTGAIQPLILRGLRKQLCCWEPFRQTNKVCQIANIDAVFGQMRDRLST